MKYLKNKNILILALVLIALAAIAFAGWKIFKKPVEKINIAPIEIPETASTTEKASVTEKVFNDETSFYEINAKYPIDGRDAEKDVEVFALYRIKEKQKDWKVGGELYNSEQELTKKFPSRADIKYIFDISYEAHSSVKKETVSYVLFSYEYTGGANGMSTVDTFTFNKDGRLPIEKIIDLSYENSLALSKIIANKILATNKDMTTPEMVNEGTGIAFLKEDGKTFDPKKCNCDGFNYAYNVQRFYIEDDGMTFLFNKYDVAPGAAGIVKVFLDWETLKPYLLDKNF